MKRIHKYILNVLDIQTITIPSKIILSVESQKSDIVVYALVDIENPIATNYEFAIFGTGHDIEINIDKFKFLDTIKMYNDSLIFHAFYREV